MVQNVYKITSLVCSSLLAIFMLFCLSSCMAPQSSITPAGRQEKYRESREPAWERQARQLEFEGNYLGAYRQVHNPYLDSLRPDLRQWLLRLLDKMSPASLQKVKAEEQNNELRCQVLEKIFVRLDENQLPSDNYAATLRDILTNCSLSESTRVRYEQLLRSSRSGVVQPSCIVGCLLPLTGEYADYGNKILQGMELALEVFHDNSRGGHDSGIKLLVRDTGGDSSRARELVGQLIDDEGVMLVLGPVTGQAAFFAAAAAESKGVNIITLTPRSGIASRGEHVFQHFLTMENQAKQIMALAVGRMGLSSLALLYPSSYYGRQSVRVFKKYARQWGADLVRVVSYDPTSKDFGRSIKELIGVKKYADYQQRKKAYEAWAQEQKAAAEKGKSDRPDSALNLAKEIGLDADELFKNPGVNKKFMTRPLLDLDYSGIIVPDFYQRIRLLVPQLAFYDLVDTRFFGTRGWNSAKLAEDAGAQVEGALFVDAFCRECAGPPRLVEYRDQYEFVFAKTASIYDAYGYDTMVLVRRVLNDLQRDGQEITSETLREKLLTLQNIPMITGITSVLPDGELEKKLYNLSFQGGHIIQVDPSCCQYHD